MGWLGWEDNHRLRSPLGVRFREHARRWYAGAFGLCAEHRDGALLDAASKEPSPQAVTPQTVTDLRVVTAWVKEEAGKLPNPRDLHHT